MNVTGEDDLRDGVGQRGGDVPRLGKDGDGRENEGGRFHRDGQEHGRPQQGGLKHLCRHHVILLYSRQSLAWRSSCHAVVP